MSNEHAAEARRQLAELQDEFSRVSRELEVLRQDTAPGSKADRINALYDEVGRIVSEWQRINRTVKALQEAGK